MTDWKAYLAAALTTLGLLFGAGKWVGQIDNRLEQLERHQRYEHGSYTLPKGAE
jgi:hypothetical protein